MIYASLGHLHSSHGIPRRAGGHALIRRCAQVIQLSAVVIGEWRLKTAQCTLPEIAAVMIPLFLCVQNVMTVLALAIAIGLKHAIIGKRRALAVALGGRDEEEEFVADHFCMDLSVIHRPIGVVIEKLRHDVCNVVVPARAGSVLRGR